MIEVSAEMLLLVRGRQELAPSARPKAAPGRKRCTGHSFCRLVVFNFIPSAIASAPRQHSPLVVVS
jgi:hypothetical protein